MTAIWERGEETWSRLAPTSYLHEKELHDLADEQVHLLPLSGQPRLVVVGREVPCGRESADLVAVDVTTNRLVVIEVKLRSNSDRRHVLTQVLGYAAFLRAQDLAGVNALLSRAGRPTIAEAVQAAVQDPTFDAAQCEEELAANLRAGSLRCVLVLDTVPDDLVGYLQEVTNERLDIDLVSLTAYDIAERRIVVPQLVEPDRWIRSAPRSAPSRARAEARPVPDPGGAVFAAAITEESKDPDQLRRLLGWSRDLEARGLARLYTTTGSGRWALNPRLPGQERSLVVVWNERGASLSPWRSVFEAEAPAALSALDDHYPNAIGSGGYLRAELTDALLTLLTEAYVEAQRRRAGA